MHEIWSACFLINRRAPKTVVDLARMPLGCLHDVLEQERALLGRYRVLKPEVGNVTELKNEDEEALAHGDLRPVDWSRRE